MQRDCIAIHQTKSINYLLTKLIRKKFCCLKTEWIRNRQMVFSTNTWHPRDHDAFTSVISFQQSGRARSNTSLTREVLGR